MLLTLKESHKEHLTILIQQPNQVLIDFCKLALDFLQNGPNEKRYNVAATKLEVTYDVIQNAVHGLLNLLLESCKNNLNQDDFRDSVITAGFNEEQAYVLTQFYENKQNEIKTTLPKFSATSKHYQDLDWRFEVQVASRQLLKEIKPTVTLALTLQEKPNGCTSIKKDTERARTEETVFLQTDIPNLVHLTDSLQGALSVIRTAQYKRLQRSFKQ